MSNGMRYWDRIAAEPLYDSATPLIRLPSYDAFTSCRPTNGDPVKVVTRAMEAHARWTAANPGELRRQCLMLMVLMSVSTAVRGHMASAYVVASAVTTTPAVAYYGRCLWRALVHNGNRATLAFVFGGNLFTALTSLYAMAASVRFVVVAVQTLALIVATRLICDDCFSHDLLVCLQDWTNGAICDRAGGWAVAPQGKKTSSSYSKRASVPPVRLPASVVDVACSASCWASKPRKSHRGVAQQDVRVGSPCNGHDDIVPLV